MTAESTGSPREPSEGSVASEGTDCSEALLRVYEFLDGELGAGDCARIQRHLDECGHCLKQYDLDTTLKSLIKRACGCEAAPPTLRMTIMERISMTVITIEGQS